MHPTLASPSCRSCYPVLASMLWLEDAWSRIAGVQPAGDGLRFHPRSPICPLHYTCSRGALPCAGICLRPWSFTQRFMPSRSFDGPPIYRLRGVTVRTPYAPCAGRSLSQLLLRDMGGWRVSGSARLITPRPAGLRQIAQWGPPLEERPIPDSLRASSVAHFAHALG